MGRKFFIGILFSFFILVSTVQSQDVSRDSVSISTRNPGLFNVQKWPILLNQWSKEIDSVKNRLAWTRKQADTTFIDSTLVFFVTKRGQLEDLSHLIAEAKISGEFFDNTNDVKDTSEIAEIIALDSITEPKPIASEKIERIENNIKRLLFDLDLLESSTQRRRQELNAMQAAKIKESPIRQQMFKTVEKNWIKDGGSKAYFELSAWNNRFFILLLSLLYFYWIFKVGKSSKQEIDDLRIHKNEPIWIAVMKALVFFLILLPFSSFNIPVFILQISYLLIFILLYLILYQDMSIFKRRVLQLIFVYYSSTILGNLLLSELWWTQIIVGLINVSGVLLVWRLGYRNDQNNPIAYLSRYLRVAIIFAHFMAIFFLILGYVNAARMCGLLAAMGLLLSLSLRAFRDMLLSDIDKQQQYANAESWLKKFDSKRVLNSSDRLIKLFCIYPVIQLIANTLNVVRETQSLLDNFLNTAHSIGNISFSYGNLILAIVVISLSNWLQKTLKSLLDTQVPSAKHSQKLTLLPLFRVFIVVVGFLVGISIMGLGLDKLTVIIGALSVGIGLGLQNIINNFVSGVILVFEKPFKIGDYVELADKKGQVMQIGIRSSTLLTDQGARVIIPNGDLLSGRLVNWTFSESDIRFNIQLLVEKSVNLTEWKEWLAQITLTFNEVDKSIPVRIWTQGITAEHYQLSVQVGIRHVNLIDKFKSKFLEAVQKEMDKRELKIASQ